MTFGELAQSYLSLALAGRPSHSEYCRIYKAHYSCPEWSLQPVTAITRFQVMQKNQTLSTAPAHANKIIGFIKQVYAWAQDTINPTTHRPYFEGENPASRIHRHETFERERLMDHHEIRLLLQKIESQNEKYHAFYLCRLLVPCRILELCTMLRKAVNLDYRPGQPAPGGKWIKDKTKNGRPHTIYIPHQAMSALSTLGAYGEYLFCGHYGRPLTTGAVRKMWGKWRKDLGIEDLQLLDFRRTLATYLYRVLKVDDLTAKAVLNHYDGRPVAIYVRLDYDYLADILQKYADWVWEFKKQDTETRFYQTIVVSSDQPVLQIESHHEVAEATTQEVNEEGPGLPDLTPIPPEVINPDAGQQGMEWPG